MPCVIACLLFFLFNKKLISIIFFSFQKVNTVFNEKKNLRKVEIFFFLFDQKSFEKRILTFFFCVECPM